MKEIIITAQRVRIELLSLLACFLVAIGTNLYAILTIGAPLSELLTSLGYVAVLAILLYGGYTLIRLLICPLIKLFKQKK